MLMPGTIDTAAVAIIQTLQPERSFLILRRAAHPDDPWSGHFSFPGGRKEQSDTDLFMTCVRETREETGIELQNDQLQKKLEPEAAGQLYNSPIWVQPFLFTLETKPQLSLDSTEIQSALWLNAKQFQDPSNHQDIEMYQNQIFPAFPVDDYYLWGFTYRLLQNILLVSRNNI